MMWQFIGVVVQVMHDYQMTEDSKDNNNTAQCNS